MAPADRSSQVLGVAIFFMILSWIAVGLRVYVRGFVSKKFGIDDKLAVVFLFIFTAYLACQIEGVNHGTGRHVEVLTPENKVKALRFWFICELLYIVCTCILKVSVGFYLLRVAMTRWHIWFLRLLMVGTVLFGATYLFMVTFQCVPVSTYWNFNPRKPGNCWKDSIVLGETFAASTLNCLADWCFGIMPIFIVWDLKIPWSTKIAVICIMGLAAIGSTATIIRAVFIPTLLHGDDFLFQTTDVAIWSTVEPGIGITAACCATLRPLLQYILFKTGLSSTTPVNEVWRKRSLRRSRAGYISSEENRRFAADDVNDLHRLSLRPDNVRSVSLISGPEGSPSRPSSSVGNVLDFLNRTAKPEACHKKSLSASTGINRTIEVSLSTAVSVKGEKRGAAEEEVELAVSPVSPLSSDTSFRRPPLPPIPSDPPHVDWSSPRVSVFTMGLSRNDDDENDDRSNASTRQSKT